MFESLEPRRLMAGKGLDASFGTNGVFAFPLGVGELGATAIEGRVAASADALFFVGRSGQIGKYTRAGTLDARWGDDGIVRGVYASLIALDERTGAFYAAGGATYGESSELFVRRFTSDGTLDDTFGDGGVAVPYSIDHGGTPTVRQLVPLADGELLIGLERRTPLAGAVFESNVYQDVGVMRLRSNGARDRTFSSKPVLALQGGTFSDRGGNESGNLYVGTYVDFQDLAVDGDGDYRAIYTRVDGSIMLPRGDDDIPLRSGKVDVKARTVTAEGVNDEAQADSWTVRAKGVAKVFLAEHDDAGRVSVVSQGATDADEPLAYAALTPGKRFRAQAFDAAVPTAVHAVARNADGNYFVSTTKTVTRVLDSLRVDRRFAFRGTGTIVGDVTLGLATDGRNGVLVGATTTDGVQMSYTSDRFERFV